MEMLEKTGAKGSNVFNRIETSGSLGEVSEEASQREADAVARAIGIPTEYSASTVLKRKSSRASETSDGGPLSKTVSAKSDYTSGGESPSPTGALSPDMSLMDEAKSPELEDLPSPELDADDEDEGDDDEEAGAGAATSKEVLRERDPSIPELRLGKDVL